MAVTLGLCSVAATCATRALFINQGCLPIAPSHPSFLKAQFVERLSLSSVSSPPVRVVVFVVFGQRFLALFIFWPVFDPDLRYDLTYLR